MERRRFMRVVGMAGLGAAALASEARRGLGQFSAAAGSESALSIPESAQVQPEALAGLIQAGGAAKPVIFQVGSKIFFGEGHIAGSVFAGPGSQAAGLQLLKSIVATTKKDAAIVLYCGCCPWTRCPNMGPAYKQLHDLGFTHVKALYLASNFGDDWVAKGYPVEHGK